MNETYDVAKAIAAQKKYVKESGAPHFAPENGRCWKCGKNIYAEGGITVEEAGSSLITGCPHCHRSYCD